MTKVSTGGDLVDGSACCGNSGLVATATAPKMSDLTNNYKTTGTAAALDATNRSLNAYACPAFKGLGSATN